MTKLIEKNFRKQVINCWLGKAVGGTLGMPFEGDDGPLDLTYYDPVPTKMIPNDDLDLQIVWACILDKLKNPCVDRYILGQAWLDHVKFPLDEYAVAIRNLRLGIKPPLTGSYDNCYMNGMGAAIRSEIWACLAPGNPALAAKYAYEDACVDHAEEGIWAAVFLASLQSAAFVENVPDTLLDSALEQLPKTSLIRQAVTDTRLWQRQGHEWLLIRKKILERYCNENFTDVTMNIAFIVLAWLASEGDFSKGICIAANCGKDTDCTAGTLGALMGILDTECIDDKWLMPIGNNLIVSPEIVGIDHPETLDEFADLILDINKRLNSEVPSCKAITQSLAPYSIQADVAFVNSKTFVKMKTEPVISFPSKYTKTKFEGVWASLNTNDFDDDVLLLRYKLNLREKQDVRLVFNSRQSNCVWIDGKYCFSRKTGSMSPSPHRQFGLKNQYKDISLEAGSHEIISAIECPTGLDTAQWIIIAADQKTLLWLPDAFMEKFIV
jgi:ADP-ribosylglycohydrolase